MYAVNVLHSLAQVRTGKDVVSGKVLGHRTPCCRGVDGMIGSKSAGSERVPDNKKNLYTV